jgi:hypothetical protein
MYRTPKELVKLLKSEDEYPEVNDPFALAKPASNDIDQFLS